MRKLVFACLFMMTCAAASAQTEEHKDWAKFYRYEQANDTVKVKPRAVFMGDSITDSWAKKDSEFFTSNNFLGVPFGLVVSHSILPS